MYSSGAIFLVYSIQQCVYLSVRVQRNDEVDSIRQFNINRKRE